MSDNILNDVLTGSILSGGSDDKAKKYLDQVAGAYDGINAPKLTPEQLQQYGWQGDVDPTLINAGADVQADPIAAAHAQAAMAGDSQMGSIKDDPALLQQEQASLGALKDLADRGGLNQADQANLNNIQNQALQTSRGQQDAIMQSMNARGQGGSGNELLAKLSASQNATNQAAQQGLDVAGQAQSRALQAMMQGGSLASQLQGQQFGEAAQKAAAQDAIIKFNAQNATSNNQFNAGADTQANEFNSNQHVGTALANRNTNIGVQGANANAVNNAAYYNKGGRQNISNANVDTGNRQNVYNTQQLPQMGFQNDMTLAGAKSGAGKAGMSYWGDQSDQSRGGWGNLMGGAIGMGTSAVNKYGNSGSAGSGGIAGGDASGAGDYAAMAAHGGRVPGHVSIPGDSFKNDKVPTILSPGETVVPRSLALHGSSHDIGSFVKHAPSIAQANKSPALDIGKLLKSLNPKHVANANAYHEKEMAEGDEDDGISSKLAALGLLSK